MVASRHITLSKDDLHELFEYVDGKLIWKSPPLRRPQLRGCEAGSVLQDGYRHISIGRRQYKAHRLIWIYHTGAEPAAQIDHINGDRDDNHIANLRDVSCSQNHRNYMLTSANTSGCVGVYWVKSRSKWKAEIKTYGKVKFLGYFDEFEAAANSRKSAEVDLEFHPNHGKRVI